MGLISRVSSRTYRETFTVELYKMNGMEAEMIYRHRMKELFKYIYLENRIQSFDHDEFEYPHNNKRLNPKELAKAGFVRGSIQFDAHEGPELLEEAMINIKLEENDDTVFCPF